MKPADVLAGLLRLIPRHARRVRLRAAWGGVGAGEAGLFVSRAFELMGTSRALADAGAPGVDDKSWRDLELPALFADLNTTITPLGGQQLYRQMRTYEFDAQRLSRRYTSCRTLQGDSALRERLQLILIALDSPSAAYIIGALLGEAPARPRHTRLIRAWAAAGLIALVATGILSLTPWIYVAVLAVNAVVTAVTQRRLAGDINELMLCRRMLGVADALAAVPGAAQLEDGAALIAERPRRAALRQGFRWLDLLAPRSEVLSYIVWIADLAFLARLLLYTHTVDRFTDSRREWVSTFELVGSLDASIAVANFLHRVPRHCQPTVTDQPVISITDGYHPLIAEPVTNSITLERRSALISGSNMAGKTAFIKMVGTNIVLGHTLGICLASRASIPRSPVMASVLGEQSLQSGKSRYFAEIEAIRGFISHAARGDCGVFVIDELFSGTNTTERIAGAKAVLQAISAHAQVLATTHDAELQQLLADRFDLYYFQEDPGIDGFFDYRLRRGISSEHNAIRLLERVGFPPAVIRDALAQASRQHTEAEGL